MHLNTLGTETVARPTNVCDFLFYLITVFAFCQGKKGLPAGCYADLRNGVAIPNASASKYLLYRPDQVFDTYVSADAYEAPPLSKKKAWGTGLGTAHKRGLLVPECERPA